MARTKQPRLPATDGGIPELEQLGYEYASLRDKRMAPLKEEVELKTKALEALHRNGLLTYKYEDLEMEIIAGPEKLKVKVSNKEEEAA